MDKKIFGLIGFPLGHSFSKSYFNEKFHVENINAEYINYEIDDIENFNTIINDPSICGLNVTIPYKKSVMTKLNEIDEIAKEVGAVNVIKFIRKNGALYLKGYNTDIVGFKNSISSLIGKENKYALILGTGGVSKAIEYSLKTMGIESLFVSRSAKPNVITYEQITKKIMEQYTIIVNASPVGMYPNIDNAPNIPYEFISEKHIVFDTIYNPTETLFMKLASKKGATVKNGLDMLKGQAVAAWDIWNDKQ